MSTFPLYVNRNDWTSEDARRVGNLLIDKAIELERGQITIADLTQGAVFYFGSKKRIASQFRDQWLFLDEQYEVCGWFSVTDDVVKYITEDCGYTKAPR